MWPWVVVIRDDLGIGTIDYSDMYAAEANTIAGATVTQAKAFGRAAATGLDDTGALPANKTYVVPHR